MAETNRVSLRRDADRIARSIYSYKEPATGRLSPDEQFVMANYKELSLWMGMFPQQIGDFWEFGLHRIQTRLMPKEETLDTIVNGMFQISNAHMDQKQPDYSSLGNMVKVLNGQVQELSRYGNAAQKLIEELIVKVLHVYKDSKHFNANPQMISEIAKLPFVNVKDDGIILPYAEEIFLPNALQEICQIFGKKAKAEISKIVQSRIKTNNKDIKNETDRHAREMESLNGIAAKLGGWKAEVDAIKTGGSVIGASKPGGRIDPQDPLIQYTM